MKWWPPEKMAKWWFYVSTVIVGLVISAAIFIPLLIARGCLHG